MSYLATFDIHLDQFYRHCFFNPTEKVLMFWLSLNNVIIELHSAHHLSQNNLKATRTGSDSARKNGRSYDFFCADWPNTLR